MIPQFRGKPFYRKIIPGNLIKVLFPAADIKNVGFIVPLPNHYMSDMPQGRGLLQTCLQQAFFWPHAVLPLFHQRAALACAAAYFGKIAETWYSNKRE
jgi:hypothetical protein